MRVGAIQLEQQKGNYPFNIDVVGKLANQALAAGCELVVIPELFSSGYLFNGFDEARQFAEPTQGKTFDLFAKLAEKYCATLVYGYVELDPTTDLLHNSAAVVDKSGLVINYRKLMPYFADTTWATDGGVMPPTFLVRDVPATVVICADAEFPELFEKYNRINPKIICLPTAWVDEKCPSMTWWARVKESSSFMVAANLSGVELGIQFSGGSTILSPHGEILARIDSGSGWIYADIDLSNATATNSTSGTLDKSLFSSTSAFSSKDLAIRPPAPISNARGGQIDLGILTDTVHLSLGDICDTAVEHCMDNGIQNTAATTLILVLPSVIDGPSEHFERATSLLSNTALKCAKHLGYEETIIVSELNINDSSARLVATSINGNCVVKRTDNGELQITSGSIPYAVISSDHLSSWSKCRELSLRGALLLTASISSCPAWPLVKRPQSQIKLPPSRELPSMDTFNIARVRAGENNVAICIANHDESEFAIESGVYGPDFFRHPYAEQLSHKHECTFKITKILIDDFPIDIGLRLPSNCSFISNEKPYLRRRKPWIYAAIAQEIKNK